MVKIQVTKSKGSKGTSSSRKQVTPAAAVPSSAGDHSKPVATTKPVVSSSSAMVVAAAPASAPASICSPPRSSAKRNLALSEGDLPISKKAKGNKGKEVATEASDQPIVPLSPFFVDGESGEVDGPYGPELKSLIGRVPQTVEAVFDAGTARAVEQAHGENLERVVHQLAYQLALTVTKAIDFNAKVRADTSTAVDEMLGEAQSLRSQITDRDLALKQAREEAAKAKKAADQLLLSAVNEKLNAIDAAKRAAEEAAQAKEGEKHALQEAKHAKEEAARLKDEAARLREERNIARMDAQSWKESTYTVQAVLEGGEATKEIRARIIDQAKDAIIEEAHEDLFYSIWLEHPDQTYRTLGPDIDLLLEQFRARKTAEDAEASKVGEGVSDLLEAEEAEAVPDQEAPEVAPPATSHEDFLAPPAP